MKLSKFLLLLFPLCFVSWIIDRATESSELSYLTAALMNVSMFGNI